MQSDAAALSADTATDPDGANLQLAGTGAINVNTGQALVLVGTNSAGNTLDLYFVSAGGAADATIAEAVAAGRAEQIASIDVVGSAIVLADFVSIA